METKDVLHRIGKFSDQEIALFEKYTSRKTVNKNHYLLEEGRICQSAFFILSGSFLQFKTDEVKEDIIDLHLEKEWMFNHQSLIEQSPSTTAIKAFTESEVIEVELNRLHILIARSPAFLQLGRVFNQAENRIYLFDHSLSPADKYNYIKTTKPDITKVFPVKMIASYLKISPETLSRVRANYRIS